MYNYDSDTIKSLQDRLDIANDLLVTLCAGLESDEIPLPPELLSWWIGHQKELDEAEKPRIQLIQ